MVSITTEIKDKLKEHIFSIPVKDVRDTFSSKKPIYPMIVVSEVMNKPVIQIQGEEKYSLLGYKFDIYAKDTSVDGSVYTKQQVLNTISEELDEFIRNTWGLKRTVTSPIIPHNSDKNILRRDMVYEGKIENETMIIYH